MKNIKAWLKFILLVLFSYSVCLAGPGFTGGGGNPPPANQLQALEQFSTLLSQYATDDNSVVIVPDEVWVNLVPTLGINWDQVDFSQWPSLQKPSWQTEGLLINSGATAIEMTDTYNDLRYWVISQSQGSYADQIKAVIETQRGAGESGYFKMPNAEEFFSNYIVSPVNNP